MRGSLQVFPSPSGRYWVTASSAYPNNFPPEFGDDILRACQGDLIELLACHGDWGLGVPVVQSYGVPLPGARGVQGAFRLEWVRGVVGHMQEGRCCRAEVDVKSVEFGFAPKVKGPAERWRARQHREDLERISLLWVVLSRAEGSPSQVRASRQIQQAEESVRLRLKLLRLSWEQRLSVEGGVVQHYHRIGGDEAGTEESKDSGSKDDESKGSASKGDASEEDTLVQRRQAAQERSLEMSLLPVSDQRGGADASGEEDPTPPHSRRPGPRKKLGVRQRLAQGLINAKRSGELHSLVETFVNTQTEMVSEASDLQALKEKMKDIMLGAHRRGELHCIAGELAREVQRKATDFERLKDRVTRRLLHMKRSGELERLARDGTTDGARVPQLLPAKERALRSLLEMKRSGELERLAQEMGDAQAKLETKAAQLRDIASRLRRGLLDAKRSGELERIAGETTEMLETQAKTIRVKIMKVLLRAHRTGELAELRGELDELSDVVPMPSPEEVSAALATRSISPGRVVPTASSVNRLVPPGMRRRWSELTSSDSDLEQKLANQWRPARALGSAASSDSEVDQKAASSGDPAASVAVAALARRPANMRSRSNSVVSDGFSDSPSETNMEAEEEGKFQTLHPS